MAGERIILHLFPPFPTSHSLHVVVAVVLVAGCYKCYFTTTNVEDAQTCWIRHVIARLYKY